MLEVLTLGYEDLTEEEKGEVSNNGSGKEYASYIKVLYKGKVIALESDAMEPEDCVFYRDLSWIAPLLQECYDLAESG